MKNLIFLVSVILLLGSTNNIQCQSLSEINNIYKDISNGFLKKNKEKLTQYLTSQYQFKYVSGMTETKEDVLSRLDLLFAVAESCWFKYDLSDFKKLSLSKISVTVSGTISYTLDDSGEILSETTVEKQIWIKYKSIWRLSESIEIKQD